MNILDVIKGDGFSCTDLTAAFLNRPHVPGQAGRLGSFQTDGVTTSTIQVDSVDGKLAIIPNTLRGAPENVAKRRSTTTRTFNIPHLPVTDTVLASEIQDVRKFGDTETSPQAAQDYVNSRIADMGDAHDATLEYGRIGAIKGIILDADGSSVIYNLYTEFGITQNTQAVPLSSAAGDIYGAIMAAIRKVEAALGANTYQRIHIFCGSQFWDDLKSHPQLKEKFAYQADIRSIREDNRFTGFEIMPGVTIEEYRGNVSGVPFVAAAEAHLFPVGTPGLFITRFGPGNFVEAANTKGLPRYAKVEPLRFDRGLQILTESNPISICTQPGALCKLTRS